MGPIKVYSLSYELELEAEVTSFSPSRPAPACCNHSDPAYSDPGDDEEIDFELFIQFYTKDKKLIRIPLPKDDIYKELIEDIYRSVTDDVADEARETCLDQAIHCLEVA